MTHAGGDDDGDGDGFTEEEGDCDDEDADRSPGLAEECDEKDNDCDGDIDENASLAEWYIDSDEDGFGTGAAILGCPDGSYVTRSGDCDDTDPAIHPNANEIWNNNIDENCTGSDHKELENSFVKISVYDESIYFTTLYNSNEIKEASGMT